MKVFWKKYRLVICVLLAAICVAAALSGWGALTMDPRTETVYIGDPTAVVYGQDEQKYVIGVQGNLWTEHIATFDHVQYMLLPRMVAIAEVGWNYEGKYFDRFATNMKRMLKLYDAYGYKYAVSYWRENGKL